ncbi:MAG: acyltransferase [Terracidiphilus sp.]
MTVLKGSDAIFLNRFRRVTRDGQWIPEVDGLRFIAVFAVILVHLLNELSLRSGRIIAIEHNYWFLARVIGDGGRGVRIFFVISGMILALPFARHFLLGAKSVSLSKYYLRRVTRLEPPYIASLVLAALLLAVYQHGFSQGFVAHALASAFYQHNLVYGRQSSINGVAWSLEVEIQFYVLAPLIMQFYRIRSKGLRRVLMLVSILSIPLAQIPFQSSWSRVELSILYYLQYFLMGLLVADIFVLDLQKMRSSWLWDVAGVAALGVIFVTASTGFCVQGLMPLPIGVLCVAAMRSHGLRQVFANQWVAVIGGMCYSIYLLHNLIIAVLFKVTRYAIIPGAVFFVNYLIQLLLTALPAVAICAVFYLLIERPCMDPKWPSKLWRALTGRQGDHIIAVLDTSGISE